MLRNIDQIPEVYSESVEIFNYNQPYSVSFKQVTTNIEACKAIIINGMKKIEKITRYERKKR